MPVPQTRTQFGRRSFCVLSGTYRLHSTKTVQSCVLSGIHGLWEPVYECIDLGLDLYAKNGK